MYTEFAGNSDTVFIWIFHELRLIYFAVKQKLVAESLSGVRKCKILLIRHFGVLIKSTFLLSAHNFPMLKCTRVFTKKK